MCPFSKQNLAKLLGIAAILTCVPQAFASIDQYKCTYEAETSLGETIGFAYDANKNLILLREHWAGVDFHPEFTLGDVNKLGDYLQFDFNFWNNGSVAMREVLSFDLASMRISAAHYIYDVEGHTSGVGTNVDGTCNLELGASDVTIVDQATPLKVSGQAEGTVEFPVVKVDALYTPPSGKTLRATLMDTARVPISAEIGQRVTFVTSVIKTDEQWAYLQAKPTEPNGNDINWAQTPFADDMQQDFMSDVVMVLMLCQDDKWRVIDYVIGPTDVHWYGWIDVYNLPEALFAEYP